MLGSFAFYCYMEGNKIIAMFKIISVQFTVPSITTFNLRTTVNHHTPPPYTLLYTPEALRQSWGNFSSIACIYDRRYWFNAIVNVWFLQSLTSHCQSKDKNFRAIIGQFYFS